MFINMASKVTKLVSRVVLIKLSDSTHQHHGNQLNQTLDIYGIDGNGLEWFKDYLFHRSATVSYDSCLSQKKEILTRVPQGSIFGPLLFLIFFNDITDVIKKANIIKYADTTVLYVADKNLEIIQNKLNQDIDAVANWLDENELIINLKKEKTESLLFGTAKRLADLNQPFNISYQGEIISETKDYKYLEMEINSGLNLNSHFEKYFKRCIWEAEITS